MLARTLGLDSEFAPAVSAYFDRLSARPAFARALAAQERGAREPAF